MSKWNTNRIIKKQNAKKTHRVHSHSKLNKLCNTNRYKKWSSSVINNYNLTTIYIVFLQNKCKNTHPRHLLKHTAAVNVIILNLNLICKTDPFRNANIHKASHHISDIWLIWMNASLSNNQSKLSSIYKKIDDRQVVLACGDWWRFHSVIPTST